VTGTNWSKTLSKLDTRWRTSYLVARIMMSRDFKSDPGGGPLIRGDGESLEDVLSDGIRASGSTSPQRIVIDDL
jgi:hypothetical protein